ncbi:serine hydrolase [Ascidiimonas aurantiaca]|uniref:serine hydrolase domain-containing protein n=1 Tax=Ascidiimonas aurantiaca TaxID=1685432 RepID=UPI0030EEE864
MKYLKSFLKWLAILFVLFIAVLYIFDFDYLIKGVRTIYLKGHKTAYLDDYKVFDNRTIETGNFSEPWPQHVNYNKIAATKKLDSLHENLGSVAFLIIKNDSIWHETYWEGYSESSKSNSFSMAKSMVSAMLGKAIMEGYIQGLDQPVSDFFTEFSEGMAAQMTVGDLSSMASGLDWDEAYYDPFSVTTRAYFDEKLDQVMLGIKVTEEPGKAYKYLSGSTQLLGMVVAKATGKPLSQYLSESFWKPMGAENEAFWQLDSEKNGVEKAYCCVASNARDFARFGKLYKDHGRWNGKQILDSMFIQRSITPRFKESPQYGYGWWLPQHNGKSFFMMRGHLGQYVIVAPQDNLIIVRLGHKAIKYNDQIDPFSEDIYAYIEETYKMIRNDP